MGDIKDEILIDIVKRCPIVWDLRQQNYRNTGVKDDAWSKIGKTLNCTGNEARLRFATLREKFRKEKIIKEKFTNLGTETYKEQWPLYDIMSFLAPVIKPRRKRTTMSMDGGDSFLDYTYKEEPFNNPMSMDVNQHEHEHRNNQVTEMKPNFPTLAQDILPVTVFDQQHDNEAIATSTSHQYHNIKISSPTNSITQNYLRSRSNSPSPHSKMTKTNQLLHELNSVTSTLKKNNNLERDQFQTFGEFVGDHLSSLSVNQANLLMKNIMQEIINFPK